MRTLRFSDRRLLCGLALAACSAAHAGSALDTSGNGTARAALDFRITVLPALSLNVGPERLRIEGNSGNVTLQQSARSVQLRAQREVVTHELRSSAGTAGIVTVASP